MPSQPMTAQTCAFKPRLINTKTLKLQCTLDALSINSSFLGITIFYTNNQLKKFFFFFFFQNSDLSQVNYFLCYFQTSVVIIYFPLWPSNSRHPFDNIYGSSPSTRQPKTGTSRGQEFCEPTCHKTLQNKVGLENYDK